MVHDFLSFLEKLLGKAKYSRSTEEALFHCPFCNHYKPKLSVNLKTHRWQCFPCGKAGKRNLIYIIKEVGSKEDIRTYISVFKPDVKLKDIEDKYFPDFQLTLPEEFVPLIECKDSKFAGKPMWNYLLKRGVLEEDILKHKIGTAFGGHYNNRVIFPSFDKRGNVNLFTARSLNPPKGTNAYLSPSVPRGYKNNIVLNELNINWSEPVVIVEGFVDMLKTTGNTIPLFGSSLTKDSRIFEEIVMNKTPVYLALDPDAVKKKYRIAQDFMSYDVLVYDVDVNPFEDVGAMTKEDFTIAYRNATLLDNSSLFLSKVRAMC